MDTEMIWLASAACGALLGAGATALVLQQRTARAVEQASGLRVQAAEAATARDAAMAALAEAKAETATALERAAQAIAQKDDWEKHRHHFTEAAQAAALIATRELSGKVLEDHQREREAARKETEESTRKHAAQLLERVEGITGVVSALNAQVTDARGRVDTVWQALTSPGGAGQYAEIGLENLLKSFGLVAGRDFVMQYAIASEDSGRLRPDAALFLPGDTLMVIDSKASKFLIDTAAVDATHAESARQNLARSMNTHLRNLAAKDYKTAIMQFYKEQGRGEALKRSLSVMYLPSDSACETLAQADRDFLAKAHKADIVVVGPGGLSALVGLASREIDLARQAENYQKIVDTMQDVLESVAVALGHANKLGGALRRASDGFNDFVASVNGRLLPRTRNLAALGVRPSRNRALPDQLPSFRVFAEEAPLLEMREDSEEV